MHKSKRKPLKVQFARGQPRRAILVKRGQEITQAIAISTKINLKQLQVNNFTIFAVLINWIHYVSNDTFLKYDSSCGGKSYPFGFGLLAPLQGLSTFITMKQIPLNTRKFKDGREKLKPQRVALVDDDDYEMLMRWNWTFVQEKSTAYAMRIQVINGRKASLKMHRLIMNPDAGLVIDHKDHNGLNNQKENLRICTPSQNCMNARVSKGSRSKYKGVNFCTFTNKWVATICKNKKRLTIGRYKIEEEAARAYDAKAIELHGEFANLNFHQPKSK